MYAKSNVKMLKDLNLTKTAIEYLIDILSQLRDDYIHLDIERYIDILDEMSFSQHINFMTTFGYQCTLDIMYDYCNPEAGMVISLEDYGLKRREVLYSHIFYYKTSDELYKLEIEDTDGDSVIKEKILDDVLCLDMINSLISQLKNKK